MAVNSYPSTDTPTAIFRAFNSPTFDYISIPDSLSISSVSFDIDISSPNEGVGANPTLLTVTVSSPLRNVILHNGTSDQMTPSVNYPNTVTPYQPVTVFNGDNSSGNWSLAIDNASGSTQGTLTSWRINVTYTSPAIAYIPRAGTPDPIPAVTYGRGGNVGLNYKYSFNGLRLIGTGGILDAAKVIPFSCTIEDLIISAVNSGSANSLLSLHKVSGGVDTVIANMLFEGSNTYVRRLYDTSLPANSGDIIYISADSVSAGLQSLDVQLTLKSRG